jgi:hypothetical protein
VRAPARWFHFAGRLDGARQAVVLAPAGKRPPLALLLEVDERRDYRDLDKILAAVAASVEFTAVRTPDKTADASLRTPGKTPGAGGGPAAAADALAEAKARVIQQIRNLADWWYIELPNYILTSNMDRRDRRLVSMIQEDIEHLRAAYAALIPPREPIREVSVVRVFRERREYLDYIPPEMSWSSGIWMPGKGELVISPIDLRRADQARRLTLQAVYHEAFHQYIFYAMGGRQLPPWLDEGHATLFEGCEIDSRRSTASLNENENRVATFQRLLSARRPLQLERLLRMDLATFYRGAADENYATACALVYFLRKAYPQYPGRGYETLCDRVIDAVMAAPHGGAAAAVEPILREIDIPALEEDLADFWKSRTKRSRAEKFIGFGATPRTGTVSTAPARD